MNNGDGTFQPARRVNIRFQAFGINSKPFTLSVGAVNGDTSPDLIISQFVGFDVGESFVTVLPGNGDGTFRAPIHSDIGIDLIGLAVDDFNADRKLDFATSQTDFSPGTVQVFLGNGDGIYANGESFPTGGGPGFGVATGDFNAYGRPDLAVANTFSDNVSVLLNTTQQSAPQVAAVTVNDGAAQRSRVTKLSVSFSTQVAFASIPSAAFRLTRNSDGAAVTFTATANVVGDQTVVTLTDFSGSVTQFGSLADGNYTLTTLANQVSSGGVALDGNGDGTGGDNNTQGFFRLFGDINGDRRVDIADFGVLSTSFGLHSGQAGFVAAFDFNNDGVIDIADFGQFSIRIFTVLP